MQSLSFVFHRIRISPSGIKCEFIDNSAASDQQKMKNMTTQGFSSRKKVTSDPHEWGAKGKKPFVEAKFKFVN